MSKRRKPIGAIGLSVGGLAPMVTGLVGFYGYFTQGYFVAKTGQTVPGTIAWIESSVLVLAGLGMMVLAVWQYRRS